MYLSEKYINTRDILYHGSYQQNLKELNVEYGKTSHVFKRMYYVYAAEAARLASAFTFQWRDSMGINFGRVNGGPYTLSVPTQHLHLLNKKCSMYTVPKLKFKRVITGLRGEYYSEVSVPILTEVKYKSAKDCMIKNGVIIKEI